MQLDLTRYRQPVSQFVRTFSPNEVEQEGDAYRIVAPVQVDLEIHKDKDRFRLVGKQDERTTRVPARHGLWEIRPVADVDSFRLVVVDPSQMENLTIAFDLNILVAQDPHAQMAEVLAPARSVRVVFVVAGHEEGAIWRRQVSQRRDLAIQVFDGAVDEIAGDRDEVG